jgi:ribonuclease D
MEGRFRRLRDWRNKRAETMGVEPFIVASNRLLELLAREAPDSIEKLRAVPDIGVWRVNDYGEEILAVLRSADVPRA